MKFDIDYFVWNNEHKPPTLQETVLTQHVLSSGDGMELGEKNIKETYLIN